MGNIHTSSRRTSRRTRTSVSTLIGLDSVVFIGVSFDGSGRRFGQAAAPQRLRRGVCSSLRWAGTPGYHRPRPRSKRGNRGGFLNEREVLATVEAVHERVRTRCALATSPSCMDAVASPSIGHRPSISVSSVSSMAGRPPRSSRSPALPRNSTDASSHCSARCEGRGRRHQTVGTFLPFGQCRDFAPMFAQPSRMRLGAGRHRGSPRPEPSRTAMLDRAGQRPARRAWRGEWVQPLAG
jgi:hypothetical protein